MHSSAGETIDTGDPGRRRFLVRVITTIHAAIAATLGVILGGAVASPLFEKQDENWLPAGTLTSLPEHDPLPVTLRVAREDGYNEVIARKNIFLVRTGESGVMAIDSTCTHLGCPVHWDADEQLIKCPCHGGIYDREGMVKSGPPPKALARLMTKVEGDQILVQI
jgi:menaquinol-cytochrome c reductase iron-sulfur subunit